MLRCALVITVVVAGCGRFGFDPLTGGDDVVGDGDGGIDGPTGPPATFGTIAGLAVGASHTCAVRDDSTLWCWGAAGNGQLFAGIVDYKAHSAPVASTLPRPVTAVYAGGDHTCAVLDDGSLWCVGSDFLSRLVGFDGMGWGTEPEQITGLSAGVKNVAIGLAHICANTLDDKLWCWGLGSAGQLGLGGTVDQPAPQEVAISGVLDVSAGYTHTCAVDDSNRLFCWGHNVEGQVGTGDTSDVLTPALLSLTNIVQVVAGSTHTCARSPTGAVACWGDNTDGQLGDGTTTQHLAPTLNGITDATTLAAGSYFSCAVRAGGVAWCWGINLYGQVGETTGATSLVPVAVQGLSAVAGLKSSGYSATVCARTMTNELYCWGGNSEGQLGVGHASYEPFAAPSSFAGAADVSIGSGHACIRNATGALGCIGDNSSGQLGIGTDISASSLVTPAGFATVGAFAAGPGATGAVPTSSNVLQTWGANNFSQLGVGDAADRSAPTSTGLNGVAQLSFASEHSCARKTTNEVYCWGANNLGQIGDNSTTPRASPVQVTDLATFATDVCVGGQTSCALDGSGTAFCWGSNSNKAIGDGTFMDRRRPAMVVGLPAAVADVECGQSTNCARLTTGEVWCWGYNENGEHGDGVKTSYDPTKALLPRPATDLAYRGGSGCVVLDDGRVFCWGYSTGTPLSGVIPAEVAGLTGATKVYNGGGSACAKRTDGSVWCWGANGHGELGRGYRGDGWTPDKPWLPGP